MGGAFESKFYPIPINLPKTDDVVTCVKCGCKWLELVLVQQYGKLHTVVLGQQPPPKSQTGFWLFRCPKCQELYEPNVTIGMQDQSRKDYDAFLDELEAPIPVQTLPVVKGEKV
jgi:hypothetical protein